MKKRDEESAFSAICNAQRIACAPFEFEAARSLRDFGILAALDKAGDPGLTDEEIKAGFRAFGLRSPRTPQRR